MFVHIMEYKYSNLLILPLNEKGSLNSLLLDSSLMMFCKMNLVASYQKWLCMILLYTIRNVEPEFCHSFHLLRPSYCPDGLSKRATPKAPRWCKYIVHHPWQRTAEPSETNEGCIQYTPWGVPVALFLTIHRVCEVLTSQNQSVQLRLIMYMSAQFQLIGAFGKDRHRKDKTFIW